MGAAAAPQGLSTAAALAPGVIVAATYGKCWSNFSPVRYNGCTLCIEGWYHMHLHPVCDSK